MNDLNQTIKQKQRKRHQQQTNNPPQNNKSTVNISFKSLWPCEKFSDDVNRKESPKSTACNLDTSQPPFKHPSQQFWFCKEIFLKWRWLN